MLDLDASGQGASLACSTRPRAQDHPYSRLACWSTSDENRVVYRMAANAPTCTEALLSRAATPALKGCWLSELETPSETYSVEFSFAEWGSDRFAIPTLVWRDARGRAVQASESSADWFDAFISVSRQGAPRQDHDTLLLSAVAVHVWSTCSSVVDVAEGGAEFRDWSSR